MSMRLFIGSLAITLLSGCHARDNEASSATAPRPPAMVPDPNPEPRAVHAPLRYSSPSAGPLRVGGDVTEPVLLRQVPPALSGRCSSSRIEGRFVLEAVVSASGEVTSVHTLISASAEPACPEAEVAVRDAVMRWRYKPATLAGQPVSVYLTISLAPPFR